MTDPIASGMTHLAQASACGARGAIRAVLAVAVAALPALAAAHPGALADHADAAGFLDGLYHPFTGLDHLGAMLAIGIWSSTTARRIWLAPLAFALFLLIGAFAASHGLALPAIEPMIAFSLLVFGLLLAGRAHLAPALAALLVGIFALFHGAAHGVELGTGTALAGMLLATAILHAGGISIGVMLCRRNPWWTRGAGIAVAVSGMSLLAP